jgi:hypothetical protein
MTRGKLLQNIKPPPPHAKNAIFQSILFLIKYQSKLQISYPEKGRKRKMAVKFQEIIPKLEKPELKKMISKPEIPPKESLSISSHADLAAKATAGDGFTLSATPKTRKDLILKEITRAAEADEKETGRKTGFRKDLILEEITRAAKAEADARLQQEIDARNARKARQADELKGMYDAHKDLHKLPKK